MILGLAITMVLALPSAAYADNYYINQETGDNANDGSIEHPWKTAQRVAWTDLRPGDAIYFARGQKWEGRVSVDSNGTAEQPILISAYGEGEAPILTNQEKRRTFGNCIRIRGDYVTVEKLHFDRTSDARPDLSVFQMGAVFIEEGADHARIQDCTFTDCPLSINIYGEYATITRNHMSSPGRSMQDRWRGPTAICLQSGYHDISYNTFLNFIGPSTEYNWDGGVIEVDIPTKKCDGLRIHHNTSIGNAGFIENEFWELGGRSKNWIIAYNVISDHQWFIDLGPADSIIAHNTILITQTNPELPYHFFMDPKFGRNSGIYYNNIFLSTKGIELDAIPGEIRKNNLFYCLDGSTEHPGGPSMGPGDFIADPKLVDIKNANFHLLPGSPAINAGTDIGLTNEIFMQDHDGNPVPHGKRRDIGAYEFLSDKN
jgi:hypothetical protein